MAPTSVTVWCSPSHSTWVVFVVGLVYVGMGMASGGQQGGGEVMEVGSSSPTHNAQPDKIITERNGADLRAAELGGHHLRHDRRAVVAPQLFGVFGLVFVVRHVFM